MRGSPFTLALLAASALALSALPASAAVALGGELSIAATAVADAGTPVVATQQQTAAGLPGTLNVSQTATAHGVGDFNVDTVTVGGSAQATWASANAGSVAFSNYGWTFDLPRGRIGVDSSGDMGINRPGPDWSYSFEATSNGVFQMDYAVTGSGDTFGLFGWAITFDGGPSAGGPDINDMANDPTTSGLFTAGLVAGQTYTVYLFNNANISTNGMEDFSGSMNGTFDWSITDAGVPEPATWALLVGGFGLAGSALRRRRVALS